MLAIMLRRTANLSWTVGRKAKYAQQHAQRCMSAFCGRATKRGTGQFLIDNNVTLCHQLKSTNLYVNCIVHGGPRLKSRTIDPATALIFGVLSNKSNMLQVFAHDDAYSHATWAKAALKNVFESGVSREQLVLTANLSLCKSREQLRSQIERALSVTGLEVIDMCTFQVSKDLKSAEMENTLQGLNDAFKDGLIQSIGLHCLPVRAESTADNIQELFLPEMLEHFCDQAAQQLFSVPVELVSYQISPTTEVPPTYGRLSGQEMEAEYDEEILAQLPPEFRPTNGEAPARKVTRMAIDPLLARPPDTGLEDISEFAVPLVSGYLGKEQEAILASTLDVLCPELESTPTLEEKAIRIVLSVDVELLYIHLEDAILLPKQVSLRPENLLSSSDTEAIFGNFVIPRSAFKRINS